MLFRKYYLPLQYCINSLCQISEGGLLWVFDNNSTAVWSEVRRKGTSTTNMKFTDACLLYHILFLLNPLSYTLTGVFFTGRKPKRYYSLLKISSTESNTRYLFMFHEKWEYTSG